MFESGRHAAYSHPVAAALDAVEAAVSGVADAPLWGLGSGELARLVAAHEALTARLAGLGLGLVREADRRELGSSVGAVSTADWLRDRLRLEHAVARGRVELAALLDVDVELLAAGRIVHEDARRMAAGAVHGVGYPDPVADGAGRGDPVERAGAASPGGASTAGGAPVSAVYGVGAACRRDQCGACAGGAAGVEAVAGGDRRGGVGRV